MPPAVVDALENGSNPADQNEKAKPVIGIIYPPPEVRNIVDKTASFVARNGPEFESRIRQNEINNPKFNFLNGGDPYHAYYQHKVRDFRDGKAELPPSLADAGLAPLSGAKPTPAPTAPRDVQDMFRSATDLPVAVTDPPPYYEFTADPPSISALDLDVVRLTAQFVARNGRQFLTSLMGREQRNYLFDFLRPQHALFHYFTRLLEQYTKVLIPPKELTAELQRDLDNPERVLDAVRYRVAWQRAQEARVRSEEEAQERERVSYAQIDWHQFVVVETVDYQPNEPGQFPPPTTPQLVGQRVLMQDRLEEGEEMQMSDDEEDEQEEQDEDQAQQQEEDDEEADETEEIAVPEHQKQKVVSVRTDNQVEDMEQDSSSEDERPDHEEEPAAAQQGALPVPPAAAAAAAPSERQAPPLPPQPPKLDQVLVKKYDPKAAARPSRAPAVDEFLVSPITGEKIPASRAAEHMRIGLLDPRWLEQRDRQLQDERMQQEAVLAAGGAITAHLHNLAERRTDIFGAGHAETSIGRKIGEEEQPVAATRDDKAIWDGHSSSVSSTTRAARANISVDEQISQIHRTEGLLTDSNLEKIGPKPGGNEHIPTPPSVPPLPPADMPPQPPPPGGSAPKPPLPPPPPAEPRPTPPRAPAPAPEPLRPAPQQPLLVRPIGQPLLPGGPGVVMAPRPQVLLPTRPVFAMHPTMQGGYMQPMPHAAGVAPRMGAPLMGAAPGVRVANPVGMVGLDDESMAPGAKKPRVDDHLMPEHAWLARCGGSGAHVTFTVCVPLMADKAEWKLRGQNVTLTLPLTDMVSVLKARLHDETGLPPGKQKLSHEGVFFKDSNSLAYYNVTNGSTIQLQLKERGGRKK